MSCRPDRTTSLLALALELVPVGVLVQLALALPLRV